LCNKEPANTPKREDSTRASAEPMNTYQIDVDFEARSIVESWVLSPSSAKNTNIKAVNIVLNKIVISFKMYIQYILLIKKGKYTLFHVKQYINIFNIHKCIYILY